jgi:hypothetical protein
MRQEEKAAYRQGILKSVSRLKVDAKDLYFRKRDMETYDIPTSRDSRT